MKFISTRVHGIIDYLMAIILIASPWVYDFDNGGAETWASVMVGGVIWLQALLTDYEFGIFKSISMAAHLKMDFFVGIFLAASPWLFGFADTVWATQVIFGLMEVAASLMTRTIPTHAHSSNPVHPIANQITGHNNIRL